MLQHGTTLAPAFQSDTGTTLDQDMFNKMLADAIASDPTLLIKTIEGLANATTTPKENQVIFIDSDDNPDSNGIYGFKDGRNWKRIGDVQR